MSKSLLIGSALAVAAVAGVLVGRPGAVAANSSAGVKIGADAPAWSALEGADGKQHALADLKDAKAVVVVFTCNHCPVANAYEDRVIDIAKDYHGQGVEVVAINVSNLEADKLPAMKERAEEKGYEFAYLYDPTQQIARDFGATVTPHVFVLDGEHRVVYMGAIDDNMSAQKAKTHFVREALDALLAGAAVKTAETKPSGCGIKYE